MSDDWRTNFECQNCDWQLIASSGRIFAGPDVSDLFSEAGTCVEERLVPCGWLCTEDHPPLPSKNEKKNKGGGDGWGGSWAPSVCTHYRDRKHSIPLVIANGRTRHGSPPRPSTIFPFFPPKQQTVLPPLWLDRSLSTLLYNASKWISTFILSRTYLSGCCPSVGWII